MSSISPASFSIILIDINSFMPALFRDGCVGTSIVARERAGTHWGTTHG